MLKIFTFRKGQHIPACLLGFRTDGEIVDVKAKTGSRGKVVIFSDGVVLFIGSGLRKRESVIRIDYNPALPSFTEVLHVTASAKQARELYPMFRNKAKCPNIRECQSNAS